MSDPNDKSDRTQKPDPDLLPPERNGPSYGSAAAKEPPVIEAEAEHVSDSGDDASKASQASQASKSPSDGASGNGGMGVIAAALVAGLVGAIAVGGGLYGLGYLSQSDNGAALGELTAKVEANASATEAQAGDITQLNEKLTAAEAQAGSVGAITARLDAIEAAASDVTATIEAAKTEAAAQATRLDELAAAMPPADIDMQITQLSAMVKALNTAVDVLAPKIGDLATRVAELEAKKDDPDAAERATLSLALSNLTRAATRAEPFARELDVVETFLPNEPELAELKLVAAEGVPTETSLEARFPQMVKDVLDAERAASNDGVWQKLLSNAKKLVTLRRTGEIAGDDTDAVLARMEERVKRGDLSAALAEAKGLQGAAAEAAAPWVKDTTARVTTTDLLAALTANVTKRLQAGAAN
jgi:hypothetical protein